jgi:hypothetical protein
MSAYESAPGTAPMKIVPYPMRRAPLSTRSQLPCRSRWFRCPTTISFGKPPSRPHPFQLILRGYPQLCRRGPCGNSPAMVSVRSPPNSDAP